ncbi:MAG: sensor histidine kinase [Acidobacteria bacterium]|nr:MAG: sensor histidine kinase [Acidobacteriota bacterium]
MSDRPTRDDPTGLPQTARVMAAVAAAGALALGAVGVVSWQRERVRLDREQEARAERAAAVAAAFTLRRVERSRLFLRGLAQARLLQEALAQRNAARVSAAVRRLASGTEAPLIAVLDAAGRPLGGSNALALMSLGSLSPPRSSGGAWRALLGQVAAVFDVPVTAAGRTLGTVRGAVRFGPAFLNEISHDLGVPLAILRGEISVGAAFPAPPPLPGGQSDHLAGRTELGGIPFDLAYVRLDRAPLESDPGGPPTWIVAGIDRSGVAAARRRFLWLTAGLGAGGLALMLLVTGVLLRAASTRERRLVAQRDAAAARSAGLSDRLEHLRAVVHDIKAPLTGVQLTAEQLRETAEDEGTRRALGRIIQTCERLELFLTNVLTAARAEEGPIELRREVVLAHGMLEEVAERLAILSETRGVRLATRADAPLPPFEADASLLERALANLAANAIAACGEGDEVRLFAERGDGEIVLGVEDTGPGFPFDPAQAFSRARPRVKDASLKAGSSGLGLYIVARIAEAHGGRSEAENRPGGGARTAIRIPLAGPSRDEKG